MTSYMMIRVSVMADKAMAQMAALRAQQAGLTSDINKSNRVQPLGQRHLTSLMKFGNQLQWTGRMLQYNFTMPIVAAGAAATFFALEQEKAMTHVAKVYGDTEAAAKQFRKEMGLSKKAAHDLAESYRTDELEALDDAFTALSTHYGVQKKEVLEVAGAWAAAGASGRDLAESVKSTMDAIIIGDMNAMDATKALISIQAQYNLNTKQLAATLANLNSVENQTGAQMGDLIVGFEKAAGVARSAGIETQQLAAYMAALVPATGSAASAGNALKTIISRLMSPTKEASQVMNAMGLETTALAWQSSTATERLKLMAEEFDTLGAAQQGAAASVIASRWQVNRFEILMRELINTNGYYTKALKASEDQGASFRRMQDELNTVLESSPRKMQRMLVMLQNASVEIIQPLIPHIIYLTQQIAKMTQAFADLAPETQKLILFFVVLLALIGPVIRYMGALWTLVGVLGFAVTHLAKGVLGLGGALIKGLLTPLKLIGTVGMGAVGAISSGMVAFSGAILAVFSGAFGRVLAFATRFWTIQVAIWMAGSRLLLLNTRLFTLSFLRFWAAVTLVAPTRWAAMWVVIKTITVAAFLTQGGLLSKFAVFWTRMWALTATVTTNIWGRMMVALLLLSKTFFKSMAALFARIIPILLGPWGIAIAAVVGILYTFRDQIKQIWSNITGYVHDSGMSITGSFNAIAEGIMRAFAALPQGVQDVMVAIVTVIQEAALAVYDWFQYINPWAHHSPSLVENVETGMSAVMRSFSSLSGIKKYTSAAYAEIKKFGELTSKIGMNAAAAENATNRKSLKKAGGGAALESYNKLIALSNKLKPILAAIEGKIATQERVVDRWQKKLDQANNRLERQQDKLSKLQKVLDKYQSKLDEAQESLDYYASAPLAGMRAMDDQIFSNTQTQKALRLEMMKMEDVTGTFDEVKSKMDAINGAQELLRGEQSALRGAGAGSEILSQYDAEIAMLDQQKTAYDANFEALDAMQTALDQLGREAERLDLVKSLQFDGLARQIEQAADSTKELSFEEIMAGIRGAKSEMEKYAPLVEKATADVEKQQKAVEQAEAARDRIADKLAQEEAVLQRLNDKYNEVNDAISAIEQSINDVVMAAEKMNDALDKKKKAEDAAGAKKKGAGEGYISPGLQNFLDAGKADFPDPGGKGIPPRTDWSNQADLIKQFTEDLALDTTKLFEDINPFKPLKAKAIEVWEWIKEKARIYAGEVKDFFSAAFSGIGGGGDVLKDIQKKLAPIGEFLTEMFKDIGEVIYHAWTLLWPPIKRIGQGIWDGLKRLWEEVGPKLEEFKELWGPIGKSIENLWIAIKPLLGLVVGLILLIASGLLGGIAQAIGPAIDTIARVLGGIIDFVRGMIKIVTGLLSGDWSLVWSGIVDVVVGAWNAIWGFISGMGETLFQLVWGIIKGIWDFFVWLADELVGHSVVPDMIDKIIEVFHWLKDLAMWVWKNVLKPIYDYFVDLWDKVGPELGKWWERIKNTWDNLKTAGTWFWNNVLSPVWNTIHDLWVNTVKPELEKWRARFETAWNALTTVGTWFWNNVLSPVWNTIKDLWTNNVQPELAKWGGRIETAWHHLTKLANWVQTNVLDPVKTAFETTFNAIAGWFDRNSNLFKKPVETIVNVVISAVNAIIKGLNKVADVLPGVDWDIGEITPLARGGQIPGRSAGRGFMTHGARAIVGEGKANHPEFVIPTDPTHRNRARSLLAMAAAKIGGNSGVSRRGAMGDTLKDMATVAKSNPSAAAGAVPQYDVGGWLSDKWKDAKGIAKKVADLPKDAVGKVMDTVLDGAEGQVRKANWTPIESPPLFGISQIRKWVGITDGELGKEIEDAIVKGGGGPNIQRALAWAKTQAGKPYSWGGVGPDGYDCSGFMSAIANTVMGRMPYSRLGATSTFPWGGFLPGAQPNGFTIGSTSSYAGGVGHMAGTLGGVNVESRGGDGVVIGPAARGYMDSGFNEVAHLKAKYGGILQHRTGGTNVKIGEAGRDEAIIPLPSNWTSDSLGGREIHFHGDLSFPNITSGEDAELFIQNLENMVED